MNYSAFEGLTPLEIFRKIAPEFASVPDDTVEAYLELAGVYVCVNEYGKYYNVAVALMAAAIMASPGGYSEDGSSSAGRVTSRKEGDLAISYGAISSDSSFLGGTTYGNLLEMLRKKMGGGFAIMTRGVVGCGCGW